MAKQPRSLSGKVAVVTGGGRGIGTGDRRARSRARACASRSATSTRAAAEAAAAELGDGSIGLALDVTDRAGFTAFLDEVEQRLGPIDIARQQRRDHADRRRSRRSRTRASSRQLEINLHAVIHGTQEAMRRMRPRGTGHIVNIASLAGKAALPDLRHLLRHQARRRRALRGRPRRARGTGVEVYVRDARRSSTPS